MPPSVHEDASSCSDWVGVVERRKYGKNYTLSESWLSFPFSVLAEIFMAALDLNERFPK